MKTKKDKLSKVTVIQTPKDRTIITHTPNYMVVPPKVVYDSSKNKLSVADEQKLFVKYHNIGEDAEVRTFRAYSMISNEEILKSLSCMMELSGPPSMYYTDLGIISRRYMEKIKQVMAEFEAKKEESAKACNYKPRKYK